MIKRVFVLTLLSVGVASAASVSIGNHSFESPDLTGGGATWSDTHDTWQERDGAGDSDSFTEAIPGFAADGAQHVGMNAGYYLMQDLGVTWQPNTIYTLTVAYGNRTGFTDAANVSTIGLLNFMPTAGTHATTNDVVLDAGTQAFGVASGSAIGAGTFADQDLVFATGAVAPAGNVVVFLGDNSPAGRSHFDNVRLDATLIPEPSAGILAAVAGLLLLRRRR